MAWPGMKPEEILGMSQEDFKKRLDGAASKDDLNTIKTELTNSFNTAVDSLKDSLKSLQIGPTNTNTNEPNNNNNNNNQPVIEEMPDFLTDPEGAFKARAVKEFGPVVNLTLETTARLVFNEIRDKHGDFKLFEDEIKEEIKNAPLNYKANEKYIENCYMMVKGRHADEIADHKSKREGKYFMGESSSSQTNNMPNNNGAARPILTPDEKAYAAKFDMTEEQYLESKKGLKYV